MTMSDAVLVAHLTSAQRVGLTLYGEARGGSPGLRAGIASAIGNRVKAQRPGWGLTAAEVCLKPKQFSCWSPVGGVQNYQVLINAARLVASGDDVQKAPAVLRECLAIGAEVAAGVLQDTVHAATHYYAPAAMVPRYRVPAWAIGLAPVAVIDGTHFYAGVR